MPVGEMIERSGMLEEWIIEFFATPKSQLACVEAIAGEINF